MVKKWKIITMVLVLTFSVSLISAACAPAAPKTLDEFYAENTVTTITPDVLTSTTAYGNRIFAAYWPDVVPGGQLIVKNIPEGDGLVGLNKLYAAEPDGLTISSGVGWSFGLYASYISQKPGMEFDVGKFNWLGALAVEQPMLTVSPKLEGINTVTDLKKIKNIRFGVGSPDASSAVWAALLIKWLGLEGGKIVTGYETGELGVALASGEIDASTFSSTTSMDWADSGLAKPIVHMTTRPGVDFPEIPALLDQLPQLTPEQLADFKVNEAYSQSMRVWLTTPNIPADKLEWLQNTFVKITDNEGFRRQYRRRWPVFSRLTGPEMTAMVNEALAQPTEKIKTLQEFTLQYVTAQ